MGPIIVASGTLFRAEFDSASHQATDLCNHYAVSTGRMIAMLTEFSKESRGLAAFNAVNSTI